MFTDLHEGILRLFVERAAYAVTGYEIRVGELSVSTNLTHSARCASRQQQLRRDPVLGDAYRAKLAAARREYRARMKARAA